MKLVWSQVLLLVLATDEVFGQSGDYVPIQTENGTICCLPGRPGPKGVEGIVGRYGGVVDKGEPGEVVYRDGLCHANQTCPPGSKGIRGEWGDKGEKGEQGTHGRPGETGISGEDGLVGPDGPPGPGSENIIFLPYSPNKASGEVCYSFRRYCYGKSELSPILYYIPPFISIEVLHGHMTKRIKSETMDYLQLDNKLTITWYELSVFTGSA